MKFLILLLSTVFASSQANQDGNINMALETVLEFDGKEVDADKVFINKVQGFLEKIRTAITRRKNSRLIDKDNQKFSSFLENLFSVIGNLDKKDMGLITKTIEKEVQRRNSQDDSFRKLFESPVVRRSFDKGLLTLKKMNPSDSAEDPGQLGKGPNFKSTVQNWTSKLMYWVKNMFHNDNTEKVPDGFSKVIDDLQEYSKSKSEDSQRAYKLDSTQKKVKEIDEALHNPEKLVNIVKNALRSLLFDQYSNLDTKKRDEIQMKLQNFLMDYEDNKSDRMKKNQKEKIAKWSYREPAMKQPRFLQMNKDSKSISFENRNYKKAETEESKSSAPDKASDSISPEKTASPGSSDSELSKTDENIARSGPSHESRDDFERLFESSLKTPRTVGTSPAFPREKPPNHNGRNRAIFEMNFSSNSAQNLEDMSEIQEALQKRAQLKDKKTTDDTKSYERRHSRSSRKKHKDKSCKNKSHDSKSSIDTELEKKSLERHLINVGKSKLSMKRINEIKQMLYENIPGMGSTTEKAKTTTLQVIEEYVGQISVVQNDFTDHSIERKRSKKGQQNDAKQTVPRADTKAADEHEINNRDENLKHESDSKMNFRAVAEDTSVVTEKLSVTQTTPLINTTKLENNSFNGESKRARDDIGNNTQQNREAPPIMHSQLAYKNQDSTDDNPNVDNPSFNVAGLKNKTDSESRVNVEVSSPTTLREIVEVNDLTDNIHRGASTSATVQQDMIKSVNDTDDKLSNSAETMALYKALEEQERKYGLDDLLDNTDLTDLKTLNISFINQNHLELTTVADALPEITFNPTMSRLVSVLV